jgi:zinc protease
MPRRKTTFAFILLSAALFGLASSHFVIGLPQKPRRPKQTETWRKQPPKADAPRPFKLPAAREVKLENGLTLVLIEDHRSPIVSVRVGIPLELIPGDVGQLTNQIALAEATAELITEGAGSRSSEQLSREIEMLGGRISSSANDDYAEVAALAVAENSEKMLALLGDVLLRPTFPETEVALYKRNRIQNLVVQRQDPAFLVGEQFDRVIFGAHSYGISSPTPASINALDRAKIASFYNSKFTPDTSVVVIVGDFESSRMETKARELLAAWRAPQNKSAPAASSIELPRPSSRRVYLIDRPGSEQADFRIGGLAVKRSDADYFPLLVANAILGAGTNSRLFLNIRERKGYAYDVSSSVDALRLAGTFFSGAETRTEVIALAIKEMFREFDRLREAKVTPRELQDAKNYLNGLFSLSLSTQGGIAERTLQTLVLDLGRDYLESYRSRIDAVTAEQVQEAATKYILSDRAALVVVGDASKLREQLKAMGPLELLDSEGNPMK